jgi:hypothetical protein
LSSPANSKVVGSRTISQESGAAPQEKEPAEKLQSKVKRYLEGVKAKNTSEIRERLGEDLIVYNSIQARYRRELMASNLLGGGRDSLQPMAGFVDIGDGRILSGGLKIDIDAKKVVCCSFAQDWQCLKCEQHKSRPAFKIRGVADSSCSPQVVVLSDQAFPACLPSNTAKDCIKILLMEGGSLLELVEEFFARLGNRRVPPGSTLLLYSCSNLADTGVAGYAEELLAVTKVIQDKIGSRTRVLPLPPISLGGVELPATCRSIFELINWSIDYYGEDQYFLEEATKKARELLIDLGEDMWRTTASGILSCSVSYFKTP